MDSRLLRALLVAGTVACLMVQRDIAQPVAAQTVGWCSSNGGYVLRQGWLVGGAILKYGEDNLVGFDGGRNTAQQCWDAALGWVNEPDHPQSVGDTPASMCAEYPQPYAIDSQFYSGVSFDDEFLGWPTATYYCY